MEEKIKILFVIEKYAGRDASSGLTNSLHNFVGSLEQLKIAQITCLHFDEYVRQNNRPVDDHLIDISKDADLVFFTYFPHGYNPTADTIKKLKPPVVCMWFDSTEWTIPNYQSVALNIFIDQFVEET